MDVINFSGGGPQTDPASDAIIEAVRNVAAAGVVPVISAGNDRDEYGLGSAGSPGTAPDAISVAAVSNAHVYVPALRVIASEAPDVLTHIPFVRTAGAATPAAWGNADQQLVDVGTIMGTGGVPVPRDLCGPPGNLDGGRSPLPARLADRCDRARLARRLHVRAQGRTRARRRSDGHRSRRQPAGRGQRRSDSTRRPGRNDRRPRRLCAALVSGRSRRTDCDPDRPGAAGAPDRTQRHRHELLVRGPDGLRTHAQAGRRRSRRPDPLGHTQELRRPLRRVRRDEHVCATHRRGCGAPAAAPPGLDGPTGQVGARLHGGHGLGGHRAHH